MKNLTFSKVFYLMLLWLLVTPAGVLALEITSVSPSGAVLQSNVVLEVITDMSANCSYMLGSNSGVMNGGGTNHDLTLFLEDGEYSVQFGCSDGVIMANDYSEFLVDTTAPIIEFEDFPEEITNQPYQAEIATDKASTCKYSSIETDYENMENFLEKISSNRHFLIVDSMQQGFYSYNIACKDSQDRVSLENREFFVNHKPTAQISLSEEGPLKAGLFEVTLLSSEQLSQTPSLSYSFEGKNRIVSLKKNGNLWEGYILIEASDGNKIATFNFLGKDASGLDGNEITEGKIFLIDTVLPEKVETFSAEPDDEEILLKWTYISDVEEFILYRSSSAGVSEVDEYKTVDSKEYVDTDVDEGKTYFYKIAAVDDAGNIGELSEEIEVSALKIKSDDGLDPLLLFELERKMSNVESELFDYETALKNLQKTSDQNIVRIDNDYGVSSDLSDAINTLEDIIEEMEKMKTEDFSKSEFDKRIEKYDEQIDSLKENTYVGVRILDEKTITLAPDNSEINTAISEYLLGTEISDELRDNYTLEMIQLQTQVRVTARMLSAELQSQKDDKKVTLIEKEVNSNSELDRVSVVEIIPKDLLRTASEARFSNNPIILKEDPIVQWDASSLTSQKFSYRIEEQKNTNLLSLTATVVLKRPIIPSKDLNEVTGNVIADEDLGGNGTFWKYSLLIFFALVVAGLTGYYYFYNNSSSSPEDFEFSAKKIDQLLLSAHSAIDAMQTDKAKSLYVDIYKLYLGLSETKKTSVYSSVNSLHSKILLSDALANLHDAVEEKNNQKFAKYSSVVESHKNLTLQGSILCNYLESSMQYFSERKSLL